MNDRPRILCIGTHHKTGTVWMRRVWRLIAEDLEIPFHPLHRPKKWAALPDTGRVICVNWSSRFDQALFDREDARFLHIIRDPRDVLLSGARYHETAPGRHEAFLHRPNPDWDGLTYQEHLRRLDTQEKKLAFEMTQRHALTVREMLDWPYGHPRVMDLRYEKLMKDTDCAQFRKAARFFGFSETETARAVEIFFENSLFGGLTKDSGIGRVKTHVSSSEPTQWISSLPEETARLYLERHGGDLVALGYESDQNWLNKLQPEQQLAAGGL